ncbi:RNA 2',3'-cyclic phosphodiesterase [Photobacterium halotolerans]|uniref:RNA 2',3'-cyclic phosphodiesterase n=1 Tax=Photobacterium halotolerans TaxID=265726 RepID=UPI001372B91D|nr:RNA 2',3'-cyclic phosphodiesterase [Photobacterium halotolerans]NAX47107.1 RNA 2',3'-cyclic phosphodiesterase [Photobacterium halotolerans]
MSHHSGTHHSGQPDFPHPPDSRRMFFALPLTEPPAANQAPYQRLCQLKDAIPGKGRTVPDANLHMTLAFLGQITDKQASQLIRDVSQLAIPAFSMHFNLLRYWKRSRVLWLGSDTCPEPLELLATQLNGLAQALGLRQDTRRYTPHITLRKNLRQRPVLPDEQPDFLFHFQRFGLYISETNGPGVRYRLANQWPLIQPEIAVQDSE